MYFSNCETVAEVKSLYRRLAFKNHPDRGGDTKTMQEINAEYHAKLKSLNGFSSVGNDGKRHTYYYRQAVEQELIDKIYQLLALKMQGVTVELIGTWIWIHGETKIHKDKLKNLKCKWHGKRKCWYFRTFQYRTTYSGASFESMRNMYGSNIYENDSDSNNTLLN